MTVKDVLGKLNNVKANGNNQWQASCPAHKDGKTASLSISTGSDGKILLHCHAGCKYEDIAKTLGVEKKKKAPAKTKSKIVATYDYVDPKGNLLYQAVRMDPKDFRQRKPNGKDAKGNIKWVWGTKDVDKVLYRLPDVIQAQEVYVVEGERDVASLANLGLTGTCNVGGAMKWKDEYNTYLTGKDVFVLPDNDKPGQDHAVSVAESLCGTAGAVKIVNLPGVPDKGDLTDWAKAGGTAAQLKALATQAQVYTPTVIILSDDRVEIIAKEFERRSRYKHRWHLEDHWSMYKNGQYQEIEADGQLDKHVSDFMIKCRIQLPKKGLVPVLLSESRIKDVIAQLRRLDSVYLYPSQSAPCSLTGALDPQEIVAVRNGLLGWSSHPYKLHPPTPDYYCLAYLPYDYQPGAKRDLWDNYLADTCCGDPDLEELLQLWAGYCLMKHDREQQYFMILYGDTQTGKGVFTRVLTHMLGEDNVSDVPLSMFSEPHFLATTYGRMMNVCDETGQHLEKEIENQLKTYAGGGRVTFKQIYDKPRSEYPTAKVLITTNHLPEFKDTSGAMWRRVLICPFNHTVTSVKRDERLVEKIVTNEMSGVLEWALDGARKIMRHGRITNPKASDIVLKEYREDAIPERRFLRENFLDCDPADSSLAVPADILRAIYVEWCKIEGLKPKSTKNVAFTMRKMFKTCNRKAVRLRLQAGFEVKKCWVGMTLRQDSDFHQIWNGQY